MHLYLWKVERLENRLKKYIGGQFQIETQDGIYRGEVASYEIDKKSKERRFTVEFKWWCIRRIKNHDIHTNTRIVYWEEIPMNRESVEEVLILDSSGTIFKEIGKTEKSG